MARFQAFISYKHAASTSFAENLELALKAYAKPWLRPPQEIFRDEKYLRPGVDLPEMIRQALEDSEFLIYLASPEAAESRWVQRELEQWCSEPGRVQRLIVVLTGGTLATDPETAEIDWQATDVLPELLRAHLAKVPLYVDLSWASDAERQTLLDPDYKKAVNLIVAGLRRIDPIVMSGEEIRQHRRNVRLRNGFVAAIALLAVGLGIVAWFAWQQTLEARRQRAETEVQRAEAEARAREATSRRLAAEADRLTEDRMDTPLLMMAQAWRMGDNSALRASWWRLLGGAALPEVYLPDKAQDAFFDPDAVLWLETAAGPASFAFAEGRWGAAPGRDRPPAAAGAAGDWSWEGGCEDGSCEGEGVPWSCASLTSRTIGPYGDQDDFCVGGELRVPGWCFGQAVTVPGIDVSARLDGPWLEVETERGLYRFTCSDEQQVQVATAPPDYFPTGGTVRGRRILDLGEILAGPPARSVSWSEDRAWLAVVREDGTVEVWPRPGDRPAGSRLGVRSLDPLTATALAAAPGGVVAVAVRGGQQEAPVEVRVWPDVETALAGGGADHRLSTELPARGRHRGVLALSAAGGRLVAGDRVELHAWDLASGEPLGQRPYLGRHRALSVSLSADGRLLATAAESLDPLAGAPPSLWLFSPGREQELARLGEGTRVAAFDPVRPGVLWAAGAEGVVRWTTGDDGPQGEPEVLAEDPVERLAVEPGRGRLAVATEEGRLLLLDPDDPERRFSSWRRSGTTHDLAFLVPDGFLLRASSLGLEAWHWAEDTWFLLSSEYHLAVAPLGDRRVIALAADRVLVYDLDPARWLATTCGLVNRNLTREEWDLYIGEGFAYECACPGLPPGEGVVADACS